MGKHLRACLRSIPLAVLRTCGTSDAEIRSPKPVWCGKRKVSVMSRERVAARFWRP